MRTIKLVLAYDGSAYAGWQYQLGHPTLQQALERAIEKVTGESLRVESGWVLVRYGEGRDAINTSTGVGVPTVREGDLDVIWNVPGVPALQFRFRNAYVAEGGDRVLPAFRIILNYELPLL